MIIDHTQYLFTLTPQILKRPSAPFSSKSEVKSASVGMVAPLTPCLEKWFHFSIIWFWSWIGPYLVHRNQIVSKSCMNTFPPDLLIGKNIPLYKCKRLKDITVERTENHQNFLEEFSWSNCLRFSTHNDMTCASNSSFSVKINN